MQQLAGRYDLEVEVARGRGRTLWRGHDTVLDRPVGVLLLEPNHPYAYDVRQAAQRAAAVEHPGLLRVVDTAEEADGRVFVVTRWLAGTPLSETLAVNALSPDEARQVALSVAEALAAAARDGVHHLVLDPRDVLLTDFGVVVAGTGVRAALEGVVSGEDAEQIDAWRIGALLYASLTSRWPGGPRAGLANAPMVGGRVARPRQVRAGVPASLDDLAWRALHDDVPHPLTTPAAIADALRGERSDSERARSTPGREPVNNAWRWLGLLLVLALFSTGAVLIAWQFWQSSERGQPGTVGASTPTGSASPSSSPTTESGPLPIRHATAFDPSGDGQENDDEAPLAIDGDATTQWSTLTYASRNLGGLKPGVGLQLAVNQDQPIGGIELRLDGRGSDLQVWAARPETDPKGAPPKVPPADDPLQGYHKLASVRGASDLVTLRFSPAVTTNRIVVWFTALPAVSDGYRVGIVEATLFS